MHTKDYKHFPKSSDYHTGNNRAQAIKCIVDISDCSPIVFPTGPNTNRVRGTIIAMVNIGVNKFRTTIGSTLSKNF